MKYSDLIFEWLKECGFTHCYFVAGGNIMHLLNSARQSMTCIPVVNEVAAVIATEYHNATLNSLDKINTNGKAVTLVTAGPGLTNTITGFAGAWLESRELLVLGGQVKVKDLAPQGLRQLGIQEIDGVALTSSISKKSVCLKETICRDEFMKLISNSWTDRKGPVFIELPLDLQAKKISNQTSDSKCLNLDVKHPLQTSLIDNTLVEDLSLEIRSSKRPVLLIGGGLSRETAFRLEHLLSKLSLPIMTTWNGSDRYGADHSNYFGRPNTWGQRYSNLLIQQADLLVALGSRLGLQQTGFNWQQFVPKGKIVQVDIDQLELDKPNPDLYKALKIDVNLFLESLLNFDLGKHKDWLEYCKLVKEKLPVSEEANLCSSKYLNPFDMVGKLSELCSSSDHVIPCSSGGAFTVMMQTFVVKQGQTLITNKGLASMGYGLSGAIGCSICDQSRRTILVEGDGGFTQNLQELATVSANKLNLKIFLFCNEGYASIRMTQKNYFGGAYIGCDLKSGLGFPNWHKLGEAYSIEVFTLGSDWWLNSKFNQLWSQEGPTIFLVPLDPDQTYFPKISSRVCEDGGMESNPLHLMTPELKPELNKLVTRFLQ